MLLTGHKSRAIFDRYNIINEQELLDAGDQLVEYLAQQAQAVPARRRPHTAAPRTTPALRLVATRHRVSPPGPRLTASGRGAGHRTFVRRSSRPGPRVLAGPRSWHTRRRGGPTRPKTRTRWTWLRGSMPRGCAPSAENRPDVVLFGTNREAPRGASVPTPAASARTPAQPEPHGAGARVLGRAGVPVVHHGQQAIRPAAVYRELPHDLGRRAGDV